MADVFVLGHRGMLGHAVARFLRLRGHRVVTDDARYEPEDRPALIAAVRESDCDFVVNALGVIKQKTNAWAPMVAANGLFPVQLRAQLDPSQRLIHASTDCVFSGTRGHYSVDDSVDAHDVYGLSKVLGERVAFMPATVVVRTSTIGPELGSAFGLMAWLTKQRGTVRGFTDHRWNGVTTLEWAKMAAAYVEGVCPWRDGIVHVTCASPVTKHELLLAIRDRWKIGVEVQPCVTGEAIDRTLIGEGRSTIAQQLDELREWTGA